MTAQDHTDAVPSVLTVHLREIDLDRWEWIPHVWPYHGHPDPRSWADAVSRRVAKRSRLAFMKRGALRDDLVELSRSRDGVGTAWSVAYVPDLSRPARVIRITATDSRLGPYASLESFLQLDQPGLDGAPEIEPFTSPHLGPGVVAVKRRRGADGTLAAVRSYGWTLQTAYVSIAYADYDLALMAKLQPELDALARALDVDEVLQGPSSATGHTTA
ncbi:hypothetical protein KXS11_17380 [Plantibacter flavus]|uniref:hypothetical protein n=1 Tax=Plantibacter flavus TaxID=150123 RepID=UPI003F171959